MMIIAPPSHCCASIVSPASKYEATAAIISSNNMMTIACVAGVAGSTYCTSSAMTTSTKPLPTTSGHAPLTAAMLCVASAWPNMSATQDTTATPLITLSDFAATLQPSARRTSTLASTKLKPEVSPNHSG